MMENQIFGCLMDRLIDPSPKDKDLKVMESQTPSRWWPLHPKRIA
jgi:hypothetical protein